MGVEMSDARYVVFQSKGKWYWRLQAENGEIVGGSEAYTRREDAHRGAIDNQLASQYARVVDEADLD